MFFGGELQKDAKKLKFWHFWECPLYENLYTSKVQISFYRSHLLPSDPVLGYYLWRVAKIQAVEMNQTITARDLLQQVSLWLINRKTKMVDNLHIPASVFEEYYSKILVTFLGWLISCGTLWLYCKLELQICGTSRNPRLPRTWPNWGQKMLLIIFSGWVGLRNAVLGQVEVFYTDIKYFILRISGINLEFWWKIYFAFLNFILPVISFNDEYYTFLLAYSVILLHHFRLYLSDFCSLKHFMNH